jgi:predicted Rossmann-fold nucleotide-binding protein
MGIVSDAVLDAGGKTIGVIPRAMITKGGEGEDLIPGAEPSKPDPDNVQIYPYSENFMELTFQFYLQAETVRLFEVNVKTTY